LQFFKRNTIAKIVKWKAENYPGYMQSNTSFVEVGDVTKYTGFYSLLVDLPEPLMFLYELRHYEKGDYVKSFLSNEAEACYFLRMSKGNPLVRSLYEDFRRFGKIPLRCPVKKVMANVSLELADFAISIFQSLYYLKDYPIPTKLFPVILPSDKFRFDYAIRMRVDGKLVDIFSLELFIKFVANNKTA
jgi:Protein of unknown function (DUF1091)